MPRQKFDLIIIKLPFSGQAETRLIIAELPFASDVKAEK